jgi:POT family proton-dependent oligopeptide transporter
MLRSIARRGGGIGRPPVTRDSTANALAPEMRMTATPDGTVPELSAKIVSVADMAAHCASPARVARGRKDRDVERMECLDNSEPRSGDSRPASPDRSFLGHPRGLGFLAFTEAFERFSFYGMQALLVLYMVHALLLPGEVEQVLLMAPLRRLLGGVDGQPLASRIFGLYTAFVYLTPILGGLIADRWLGKRRTILLGGAIMALGHFLMVFPPLFLLALLCLVLGCGLFKGNIASQVGALYRPDDLRRADAFQIFYLGINAGVIASPLIVGTLGERLGWHWGFGAAGVGMLVGLGVYVAGGRFLPAESRPARVGRAARPPFGPGNRLAMAVLLLLIPTLAVAIVPNNQIFNAYLVWADQRFDLNFAGERLPTTWLVTLDAAVSVSFLAGVALFYRWWKRRHREPDEITKMCIGSLFSVAGMLCLAAAGAVPPDRPIGLGLPLLFHVLNSIGFAHILPVSLALFARLAPPAVGSTAIGFYYLAFFLGSALVGWAGGLMGDMGPVAFWLMHAGFAAAAGLVFLALRWRVWRRLA